MWKYLHRSIYSGVLQFYLFMRLFWRTPSTLKIVNQVRSSIDANLKMVERRGPDNFPRFPPQKRCAWTIPEIALKTLLPKTNKIHHFTVFIAINGQGLRRSRPFLSTFVEIGIGTHQQYIKALCEQRRLNNQLGCSMANLLE